MAHFKPGDRIDCKIKDNVIVTPYSDYDEIWTFEILATATYGYYIFVPQYRYIKHSLIINAYRCKQYDIASRFLNEQMTHITDTLIYQVRQKLDGMMCSKCGEFFLMGAPNQPDGTLLCYSCKRNPY